MDLLKLEGSDVRYRTGGNQIAAARGCYRWVKYSTGDVKVRVARRLNGQ